MHLLLLAVIIGAGAVGAHIIVAGAHFESIGSLAMIVR